MEKNTEQEILVVLREIAEVNRQILEEIRRGRKAQVLKTENEVQLEEFIEESCWKSEPSVVKAGYPTFAVRSEMYQAYLRWADMSGLNKMTRTVFGRTLTKLGYPSTVMLIERESGANPVGVRVARGICLRMDVAWM